MREIYQQTVEEVLDHVESWESGLTSEQVKRSREKCGWKHPLVIGQTCCFPAALSHMGVAKRL